MSWIESFPVHPYLIHNGLLGALLKVGATPGFTKACQEIVLDKHVKLIDSPGIVLADAEAGSAADLALRNCVKVEALADPVTPVRPPLSRVTLCGSLAFNTALLCS